MPLRPLKKRKFTYRGRVAIITGGSRGLGLLMARRLKEQGARLVLLARNKEELRRAEDELDDGSGTVRAIVCDVTERQHVQHAVEAAFQRFGRIDVLINNAGIIQVGPIEHMTYGDFQLAMNVHFWGALHCTEAVLPHMRRHRSGRIINIASIGGLVAVPHLAPYSASKFALVGYSNAVRAEVAKYGIRVTTVCPGLMRTGSAVNALMKGPARGRVPVVRCIELDAPDFDRRPPGRAQDSRSGPPRRSASDHYAASEGRGDSRAAHAEHDGTADVPGNPFPSRPWRTARR